MKPTPHKHAVEIKAWADGHVIQFRYSGEQDEKWTDCIAERPQWHIHNEYRVKPREFPKSSLSYQDLSDLHNKCASSHAKENSHEGYVTYFARRVADEAVKQYILDQEKEQ